MAKSDLIYVENFYADSSSVVLNVCFNSDSASHVHTLAIKNGSTTLFTIGNITSASTGNVVMAITLSSAERATLLNAMSSVMEMTLTCELSTDSLGSSSVTTIAKIDAETSKPTAGTIAAPVETNPLVMAITLGVGKYVCGQSSVTVAVSGFSANNGATISTFTIEVDGIVKQASNGTITIGTLNKVGNIDAKYILTDSRGLTIQGGVVWRYQGFSYSVLDYNLAITTFSVARGSGDNIAVSLQGVCKNNFYGTNNIQQIVIYTKAYGTSVWDSGTSILGYSIGTNSFSYSGNAITLSSASAYDIKISVFDMLSSHSITTSIGVATPHISIRENEILLGQDIKPLTANGCNLGSNVLPFNNLYCSNLHLPSSMVSQYGSSAFQRAVTNPDGSISVTIAKNFNTTTSNVTGGFYWADIGYISKFLGVDGTEMRFTTIYNVNVGAQFTAGNGVAYIGAIYQTPVGGRAIPNIYIARGSSASIIGTVYITITGV